MKSDFWNMPKNVMPLAAALGVVVLLAFIIAGCATGHSTVELQRLGGEYARCKSLQGEYGGGKCFKDGKEV